MRTAKRKYFLPLENLEELDANNCKKKKKGNFLEIRIYNQLMNMSNFHTNIPTKWKK
jgi:hypothetical protein